MGGGCVVLVEVGDERPDKNRMEACEPPPHHCSWQLPTSSFVVVAGVLIPRRGEERMPTNKKERRRYQRDEDDTETGTFRK